MFEISNSIFSIIGIKVEYLNVQSIIINSYYAKALKVIKSFKLPSPPTFIQKLYKYCSSFYKKISNHSLDLFNILQKCHTVVSDYIINTMKTTFDLNFDLYQAGYSMDTLKHGSQEKLSIKKASV